MDVACPTCSAMYPISEQKLAGRVVRFRCKQCATPILVDGRGAASSPPGPPSQPTSAPGSAANRVAPSVPPPRLGPPPLPPEVFAPGYGAQPSVAPSPGTSAPPAVTQGAGAASPAATSSSAANSDSGLAMVVPLTRPTHAGRGLPSQPGLAPVRAPSSPSASSQPLPPPGGWPDVDPSVYEDETVAMTASELEAAADAKGSLPPAAPAPFRSQPPPKPWPSPLPSLTPSSPRSPAPHHLPNGYGAPGLGAAFGAAAGGAPLVGAPNAPSIPPMFQPPQPPVSSDGSAYPSAGVPSSGVAAVGQQSYPPPSYQSQPPTFPPSTRAESWALGGPPTMTTASPFEARQSSSPSARTWTSVEPHVSPQRENRWLFPLLLVTLGLGGLTLGGVLGRTWIAHVINPGQTPVTVSAAAPPSDPNLAPFAPLDANAAIEAAQRDAVNCLSAEASPLSGLILARFTPAGVLDQLQMSGNLGTAPEAPCVRSIFEKVRVAPFSGPPAQVEKAIELRPRP